MNAARVGSEPGSGDMFNSLKLATVVTMFIRAYFAKASAGVAVSRSFQAPHCGPTLPPPTPPRAPKRGQRGGGVIAVSFVRVASGPWDIERCFIFMCRWLSCDVSMGR
jgi:hypothetical protein